MGLESQHITVGSGEYFVSFCDENKGPLFEKHKYIILI